VHAKTQLLHAALFELPFACCCCGRLCAQLSPKMSAARRAADESSLPPLAPARMVANCSHPLHQIPFPATPLIGHEAFVACVSLQVPFLANMGDSMGEIRTLFSAEVVACIRASEAAAEIGHQRAEGDSARPLPSPKPAA
jgi:hypothetical protein